MSILNLIKKFRNRKEIFFEKDFQNFAKLLQKNIREENKIGDDEVLDIFFEDFSEGVISLSGKEMIIEFSIDNTEWLPIEFKLNEGAKRCSSLKEFINEWYKRGGEIVA